MSQPPKAPMVAPSARCSACSGECSNDSSASPGSCAGHGADGSLRDPRPARRLRSMICTVQHPAGWVQTRPATADYRPPTSTREGTRRPPMTSLTLSTASPATTKADALVVAAYRAPTAPSPTTPRSRPPSRPPRWPARPASPAPSPPFRARAWGQRGSDRRRRDRQGTGRRLHRDVRRRVVRAGAAGRRRRVPRARRPRQGGLHPRGHRPDRRGRGTSAGRVRLRHLQEAGQAAPVERDRAHRRIRREGDRRTPWRAPSSPPRRWPSPASLINSRAQRPVSGGVRGPRLRRRRATPV